MIELHRRLDERLPQLQLPIVPRSTRVGVFEDALEQEGWEVTLLLPRPIGATWDAEELFLTRRTVGALFDEIVREAGAQLPGTTLVSVTSDEGPAEDMADATGEDMGSDLAGVGRTQGAEGGP